MPTERPPTIDPTAAARWHESAPALSPWLHEEVARRMEDRLQWIRQAPVAWCNWEAVRGGLEGHALVSARYPKARCFVVETTRRGREAASQALSKPWWSRWVGEQARLEMPDEGAVQMLWANMALHMVADPQALMAQWHRALAVDGYLMFSCFGPDTAKELRSVYADMGWPPAGHAFTDMHDWGDMLVQAGFAEPVMDMERITLTFATPQRLLDELRELGCNLHPGRFAALRGRAWREQLHKALEQRLIDRNGSGHLYLSFENIYGHAFKPAPRVRVSCSSSVSLNDMRAMLRNGPARG